MSNNDDPSASNKAFVNNAIDAAIKIALIGAMVFLSFSIIRPFIMPVLWAIIIAVAVGPLVGKISDKLGGRRKLASTLITLAAIAAMVFPVWQLAGSSLEAVQELASDLKNDEFHIPPAPDRVAEIPMVGKKLSDFWDLASKDIKQAIKVTAPLAHDSAITLVSSITGGLTGLLQFVISFIIAGVLMVNPEKGFAASSRIATSVAGERGEEFAKLATATIRGVMTGVIGVAVIQAVLATIGLVILGVPAAGVWGVLVLVCAIAQLPPILILGPISAWAFTAYNTTPAVIFLIWSILVSASDGVLKPVLMSRGVDTPMLVILLGAIGGMMTSGIIGLFLGAVIFSITYTLFMAWVEDKNDELDDAKGNEPTAADT